jgi:hypothetical protein
MHRRREATMGFVGQLFRSNIGKKSRGATRSAVIRVIKENKDIAQAVDALAKTKSRKDAVLEVISRNPAIRSALAREILNPRK